MKGTIFHWTLLVCVSAAAWWPAIRGEAVYDDVLTLLRNPAVRELRWWGLISEPFFRDHLCYWRPLSNAGLAVAYQAGLPGVHVLAIALHTAAAIAIWSIAVRALAAPPLLATGCAALFLLHPVQVEAVAWASAAPDALAGLLGLTGLLLALSHKAHHTLVAASLLGALLAKETAVAIIPVLLLADAWAHQRWRRNAQPRLWRALAIATGVWAAARLLVVGGPASACDVPGVAQIATGAVEVWVRQLLLLPWPVDLTPFRSGPDITTGADWLWLLPASALCIAAAGIWKWRREARWLLALVAWPVAVPAAAWCMLGEFCVQDRYCYLSVAGMCCGLAFGLRRAPSGLRLLLLPAALACFVAVHRQSEVWRDPGHLVEHGLRVAPELATVQVMAGDHFLELAKKGMPDALVRARNHYERAQTAQLPASENLKRERRAAIWSGLGWVALMDEATDMPRDADTVRAFFLKAIAEHDRVAASWVGLGVVQAMAGRYAEAERALRTAIAIDATLPEAWYNLGYLQWTRGRAAEAKASFRKALIYNPGLQAARDMLSDPDGAK